MNLAAYLNDHLAGSVAAVELVEHLESKSVGMAEFFASLRGDITADQKELRTLLDRVGTESMTRKAAAWVAEKVLEARVRSGGEGFGELGLLAALEVLVLGITGKGLLWKALRHSLADSPVVQGFDLTRLEERAAEQRARVETVRLECAARALNVQAP